MDYVKLGKTGLEVSRLCLGGMTFGLPHRGLHTWTLDDEKTRPIVKRALELGINFFDTANVYSDGTSEEILGRALKEFAKRDEVVIATKVSARVRLGPNGQGLSRAAIMTEIDKSLKRLGVDHVDLYQVHRNDPTTPIEETLEALHDVVKAGKARYIGASNMTAWEFARALYVADKHGWTRFATIQDQLNLLYREEEREMLPLCRAEGVGFLPWSPIARGRLTRNPNESTERQENDDFGKMLFEKTIEADRLVIERVAAVAKARSVPRAQVALAWVLQKPEITAPVIGASKLEHFDDVVASLSLKLTPEEIAALEEPYVPRPVWG
jgi:aryl-alcohol dehydrogenase-like predicted oxidoreductase